MSISLTVPKIDEISFIEFDKHVNFSSEMEFVSFIINLCIMYGSDLSSKMILGFITSMSSTLMSLISSSFGLGGGLVPINVVSNHDI